MKIYLNCWNAVKKVPKDNLQLEMLILEAERFKINDASFYLMQPEKEEEVKPKIRRKKKVITKIKLMKLN